MAYARAVLCVEPRLPIDAPPSIRVLRAIRRRGREAEGGGLLNRYTGNTVS